MVKNRGQQKEIEDLDWIKEDPMDRVEHGIDIYDIEQREEMLDDDEITAAENAFMEGRERARREQVWELWQEKE